MVYQTFKPFDYETGEGIVVAPPQDALLRPSSFSQEHLPDLGKVWSAQERLWIQRTMFEVVAQVNKNAKSWDTAIVRQIEALEVGNPAAQDQRSIAKNETLEESAGIYAPGEEAAAADAASPAPGGLDGGKAGMYAAMMGGRGGPAGGSSEVVYYIKSANESQYKVLPVSMTVLIDQDHVQDFLVELENSPMSIQVMDFELRRPNSAVTKPEKGEALALGMGMGGMANAMMGRMGGMRGMTGMGGMMGAMQQQMSMAMQRRASGYGGGLGVAGSAERKGTSVRGIDRVKARRREGKSP